MSWGDRQRISKHVGFLLICLCIDCDEGAARAFRSGRRLRWPRPSSWKTKEKRRGRKPPPLSVAISHWGRMAAPAREGADAGGSVNPSASSNRMARLLPPTGARGRSPKTIRIHPSHGSRPLRYKTWAWRANFVTYHWGHRIVCSVIVLRDLERTELAELLCPVQRPLSFVPSLPLTKMKLIWASAAAHSKSLMRLDRCYSLAQQQPIYGSPNVSSSKTPTVPPISSSCRWSDSTRHPPPLQSSPTSNSITSIWTVAVFLLLIVKQSANWSRHGVLFVLVQIGTWQQLAAFRLGQ